MKHHSQLTLFAGELTDLRPRHYFCNDYCLVWYKFYPTLPDLTCGMMKVPYIGTKPSWIPETEDKDERESIFRFFDDTLSWFKSYLPYCQADKHGNTTEFKDKQEQQCRKLNLAPGQPFRAIIKPPVGYRCSYEYDEWDTDYYIEYTHQAEWSDSQKEKAWKQWLLSRRNLAARDLTILRRIKYVQMNHPENLFIYERFKNSYGDNNRGQGIVWTLRSDRIEFYRNTRFSSYPYYQNEVYSYEVYRTGSFYGESEVLELRQQARENIKAWLINNTNLSYKRIMKAIRKPIISND